MQNFLAGFSYLKTTQCPSAKPSPSLTNLTPYHFVTMVCWFWIAACSHSSALTRPKHAKQTNQPESRVWPSCEHSYIWKYEWAVYKSSPWIFLIRSSNLSVWTRSMPILMGASFVWIQQREEHAESNLWIFKFTKSFPYYLAAPMTQRKALQFKSNNSVRKSRFLESYCTCH